MKEFWKDFGMTKKEWQNIDAIRKIKMINSSSKVNDEIQDEIYPLFGYYNLRYPKDLFNNPQKYVLDGGVKEYIQNIARNEKKERGGIINDNKVELMFNGTENRINLNVTKKCETLFHTHPKDDSVSFDPPSILDIISFLALTIHCIAESIFKEVKGIKNAIKVQNSMVFGKDEIYVYYISGPLIKHIYNLLVQKEGSEGSKDLGVYVEFVEKLLEKMEIYYAFLLEKFNKTLNKKELEEYISYLSSLGIIMKRFTDNPEYYIF